MKRRAERASLTQGDLRKQIVRLSVPMVFGMLGLSVFNIVDTMWVGRLGTAPLAALSFTFPVVLVLNSIALGIGVGASSVLSRALGEGNLRKLSRYATDSLSLSFLLILFFVTAGELTVEPLFSLLGAGGEILTMVKQYMRIWYGGLLFVVFPMVGNSAIRALGDTRTPGTIMFIAGMVNAGLDPLLIFGFGPFPRMEIRGAAIATVLARSITFAVALYVLARRERLITLARTTVAEVLESWRKILFVGAPAAVTRIVVPVAAGVITAVLASIGPAEVAGFGAAARFERFALLGMMAIATAMAPFAGQNYGARRLDRVRRGTRFSLSLSMALGAAIFLLMVLLARPLASLFSRDPAVVAVTALYFRVVPAVYGLQGAFSISSMILNALNRPIHAAALTLAHTLLLSIPLALLGGHLFATAGVFGALVVSYTVSGSVSVLVLMRIMRREGRMASGLAAMPAKTRL